MESHTTNLGDAVAAAEQRHLAEARGMTRCRWLAADVGEDVVRRLPPFTKRHHDHRPKRLPACLIRNRGIIARGVDPRPSGDPAERIARDATTLELDWHATHQGIGADADGCDDAAGLDPRTVGQHDGPGPSFLDADAEPQLDAAATHPIDDALREPIV